MEKLNIDEIIDRARANSMADRLGIRRTGEVRSARAFILGLEQQIDDNEESAQAYFDEALREIILDKKAEELRSRENNPTKS